VTEQDWDLTVKYLGASLDKFRVGPREQGEVVAALGKLKGEIVEK
jgi:hypothetical protein